MFFVVFMFFSFGRVVLHIVFMVFPLPQTLVKTLAENLVKNLTKNLIKNLVNRPLKYAKSLNNRGSRNYRPSRGFWG